MKKSNADQVNGQLNFIQQGFTRKQCIHIKDRQCNMYWVKQTMFGCDNMYCYKTCCKSCSEFCGYRCNPSSEIKECEQ